MTLTPQEESFCAAYAEGASGAEAARLANYSAANARSQASRMLTRPQIAERVAELTAEIVQRRALQQEELAAKLGPLYEKALAAGDDDGVIQVIELQSRILGFVKTGGHTRSTFLSREMDRVAWARAEDMRRREQADWDAFQEEERQREMEEEREEAEAEAASDEQATEPETTPPKPAKANISQHSFNGVSYDDVMRSQAQERKRRRARQRNLNNRL